MITTHKPINTANNIVPSGYKEKYINTSRPKEMMMLMLSWWSTAILLIILIECTLLPRIIIDALSPPSPRILLRVCQSSGCKDDGAISTLDRMLALAPPGVDIVVGGCVSLCGSGPVVEVINNNVDGNSLTRKKKRVKGGDAISSLFDECVPTTMEMPVLKPHMLERLKSGYEMSIQAELAYAAKDYQQAIELYADAIESARKPAMLLQEAREAALGPSNTMAIIDNIHDGGYPTGLRWLVVSLKNSCRSRLVMNDVDGARRDAFAATIFSRNTDADAHECLAEVCAASSDAVGELQGLKSAVRQYDISEQEYSIPMPGVDAPARAEVARKRIHAAARKRELGFRINKLERILLG